ncbi:hypothetical protein QFZ23_004258 [Arthrobacter globiformis]|uniref:hypothetical protein n=1 Tax=Arthrobacter globiformis TaxID=1665 RepID=UPI0027886401|nr:hypothetical protein [Arthrobacter globiformis]MDQ1060357.1 hypothetical protein [Arthrobacter globiformis]
MAAAITDIPKLTLEISCTGFPHTMHEPPRDEIVSSITNFLATNGVSAGPGIAPGIGAAAGGPEVVKAAAGLSISMAKMLAKMQAERARRRVRHHLPKLTVRLESSIDVSRSGWKLPTAIPAADIVALLAEVSVMLRDDYPLVEFDYFIGGVVGAGSWANVFVPDDRLTYSVLHRLIKKLDAESRGQWFRISVRRAWWFPWGWITSNKQPLDHGQWDCRDPRAEPSAG